MLAADTAATAVRSNFRIDQDALATSVVALPMRVRSAGTAVEDTLSAVRTAVTDRRTVVLNLPLDVQAADLPGALPGSGRPAGPPQPAPSEDDVDRLAGLLPVRRAPRVTAEVPTRLFTGNPWSLDVSGGFASPLAAELITGADLIVGWSCALNMRTMRHGALVGPGGRVVQVDVDPDALGAHRPVDLGIVGDVAATAAAVAARTGTAGGYRTSEVAARCGLRCAGATCRTTTRATRRTSTRGR